MPELLPARSWALSRNGWNWLSAAISSRTSKASSLPTPGPERACAPQWLRETLKRQIDCNTAIAQAGLQNSYGAEIGKILLRSYGNSVQNRAKAWAAAGSDARMNSCELPVVINSGSGNQGITAALPGIDDERECGMSEDLLYRALVVSNLVTIHLKTGIGSPGRLLRGYQAREPARGPSMGDAIARSPIPLSMPWLSTLV